MTKARALFSRRKRGRTEYAYDKRVYDWFEATGWQLNKVNDILLPNGHRALFRATRESFGFVIVAGVEICGTANEVNGDDYLFVPSNTEKNMFLVAGDVESQIRRADFEIAQRQAAQGGSEGKQQQD